MREIWKNISDFEGYQISNKGNIRTNIPPCGRGRSTKLYPWRVVKSRIRQDGYKEIRLRKEGRPIYFSVSRLVWKIFKHPIPDGYQIDHINRKILDNRVENLRIATIQQQSFNRKKPISSKSSKYKGVYKSKYSWRAFIRYTNKLYNLGSFRSEYLAAKAYDKAAKKYFGKFANCNFSRS